MWFWEEVGLWHGWGDATHTYTHTHTHTHTHTRVCTHTHTHMCMYTHTHTHHAHDQSSFDILKCSREALLTADIWCDFEKRLLCDRDEEKLKKRSRRDSSSTGSDSDSRSDSDRWALFQQVGQWQVNALSGVDVSQCLWMEEGGCLCGSLSGVAASGLWLLTFAFHLLLGEMESPPWKARIGGVTFPLGKQGLVGLHFPLESKDWWGYIPLRKQGLVGLHFPLESKDWWGYSSPWKARIGGLHFPLESKDWWGYISPQKATLVLLCLFVVYLVDLSAAVSDKSPADGQPKTCLAVQALSRTRCMIVWCGGLCLMPVPSSQDHAYEAVTALSSTIFVCSGSDAKAASAKKTASPPSANHRGRPEARKSPPIARRQGSSSDSDSAR